MGEIILDGHKLQWHQERIRAWLRGERIAPITIDFALTRACSYRCVYCYGALQKHSLPHDLSREAIFRFFEDAAEVGVKAICLIGDGESTVSPHLYDAILKGRAVGLDMALGTNGFLLDDERLGEILPALTYLRFNISAGERARYAEIHGCPSGHFDKVLGTVRKAVELKRQGSLPVTIGLQMVLMPSFKDQILPLAELGRSLGVDYLVIKHCSDDELRSLGVDYGQYLALEGLLRQAESLSTAEYQVRAKWSKIMSGGKRRYSQCFGTPFVIQISGSGLIAPCGTLFPDRYKDLHIGNLNTERFRDLVRGDRYWAVMKRLSEEVFEDQCKYGSLCLQHKVNEYLWDVKAGAIELTPPEGPEPQHVNFI